MEIRKLILDFEPPLEWCCDKNHPIHTLGYYHFSRFCDEFRFDKEAVQEADEELLKKICGEIARYWCDLDIFKDEYIEYVNL